MAKLSLFLLRGVYLSEVYRFSRLFVTVGTYSELVRDIKIGSKEKIHKINIREIS